MATRLKLSYDGSDVAFAPCGDYWREARKFSVRELFSMKKVQSTCWIREEEVNEMIQKILRLSADGAAVGIIPLKKFILDFQIPKLQAGKPPLFNEKEA